MSFVHDDRDFPQLLTLVTEETRIAPALVEKDYWVTHCMWALHQTGLDLWFKGGTSLSKGYGIIERFSEDLDLMVQSDVHETARECAGHSWRSRELCMHLARAGARCA